MKYAIAKTADELVQLLDGASASRMVVVSHGGRLVAFYDDPAPVAPVLDSAPPVAAAPEPAPAPAPEPPAPAVVESKPAPAVRRGRFK